MPKFFFRLDARLRRWGWLVLAVFALVTTGHRLALTAPSPNRLRFSHTFTAESERAILDAAVAEFEQTHPPVKIEQTVLNSETYQTLGWRLQFRGRQPPDVFFSWQGFKVERAIDRGWAMELTPYLSPGFTNEFVPAALTAQRGGIYFLPQSVDISTLIWYQRPLFAQRGWSEPKSMEAWVQQCVELRRSGVLPLAQGNRDLWPMGNFGSELLGQSLGADGLRRLFQPGATVSAADLRGLGAFETLRRGGGFDLPGVLDGNAIGAMTDIDAKILFLAGKSAQHAVGSWFLADIADARNKHELAFPVGVFAVPSGAGELDAMTTVTTGYAVNPASRNPRAAVAFLELLLSRKYQSRFAELGNLSARRDAAEFMTEPLAKQMLSILAGTTVTVPPPDTGYRPEQAAIFYEVCGRILTGKLDLTQAAAYWNREKQALAQKGL